MRIKFWTRKLLYYLAAKFNFSLMPAGKIKQATTSSELSTESFNFLQFDNARLVELNNAYKDANAAATEHSVWQEGLISPDEIRYFRGENAYVWQTRSGNTETNYALTAYYLLSRNKLSLFDKLEEDHAFGVHTFEIMDINVSRDLLDSINEIEFLEEHLNISNIKNLNILDIGAGYGRLAYRMSRAMPNLEAYYCTDAVPVSTFLCEYYLRFREVDDRAHAIPLTDINRLQGKDIDLAINIHSFSECSLSAIEWWCKYISTLEVRYLMVVPNPGTHGGTRLSTTPSDHDFSNIIISAGYNLLVKEPKFKDPSVQRGGIFPTYYYLFEKTGSSEKLVGKNIADS